MINLIRLDEIVQIERSSSIFQAGGVTNRDNNVRDRQVSRKRAENPHPRQTEPGVYAEISPDSIELNEVPRSVDGDGDYSVQYEGGHSNRAYSDSSEQRDEDSEDNSDTNC